MRAVIPAGGFGTRWLPATKSMPKEMVPVLDKPAVEYVVDEAILSGMTDILIITGRSKRAIEDHFDAVPELEAFLQAKGKKEALAAVQAVAAGAAIHYVRQSAPLGLGHAVLQARPFVSKEAFAVLLGDDILEGDPPAAGKLKALHEELGASVFCVQPVPDNEVSRYGVIEAEKQGNGVYKVTGIVEKPKLDDAPSNLAAVGRYVFTPGILPALAETKPGVGGEIQLTDAMRKLIDSEELYAYDYPGVRHDAGTVEGWLEACLRLGLQHPRYGPHLREILPEIMKGHRPERPGSWFR